MQEYYNTNRETGETLVMSWSKAAHQKDLILKFFQDHPDALFAPHEVHRAVLPDAPLTSVRRAITNLTDQGLLLKTAKMRLGSYGKMVHRWCLRPPDLVFAGPNVNAQVGNLHSAPETDDGS